MYFFIKSYDIIINMSNNNIILPLSIIVAGGLIAVGLYFGMSSNFNVESSANLPVDDSEQNIQLSRADAELHKAYAESLNLNAEQLVECFINRTHSSKIEESSQEAASFGARGTPFFLINGATLSGAQPFSVFQESIELALSENNHSFRDEITIDGFPTMGDPNAPVLIVEYSDFACPFCGRFHNGSKREIVSEYVDTGKVLFVRKDFITVGGNSAAEAAHCAGDQGAYWEYADLLYTNQSQR